MESSAETVETADRIARFTIDLGPGEQKIIPNFVQYLRERGVAGIRAPGTPHAGALFGRVSAGDEGAVFTAARTSSNTGTEQYGVFYTSQPGSIGWIVRLLALRQDTENRSNLAILNTGESDCASNGVFRITLYDGVAGQQTNSIENVVLRPKEWRQFTGILAEYAPGVRHGYAVVTKTAGSNPFIAYAVVNDGAAPGERTGDGAFISSSP